MALFGAGAWVTACGPKTDDDISLECKSACDADDSHVQCELKIESGTLDENVWEITCADLDDPADIHAACEQACADWQELGTSRYCIETVKDLSNEPRWQAMVCDGFGYGGTDGLPPPSSDGGDGGSGADETGARAPAWDPGAYLSYNSSLDVYLIDQALVDELKADPSLLALDGSTIEEMTSGGYAFRNVYAGSLADLLGVESDDVVKSVNGHRVFTTEQALDAMGAIYNASSITLTVDRSGSLVTLDYLIR